MLYSLRKKSEKILFWAAMAVNFSFVTPNRLSLLSIPFAILSAFFLSHSDFAFGFVFALFSFFLDALDGALAKLRKKQTVFGNYLDAVSDRIVEAFIFFGLAFSFPFESAFAYALSFLASHSKALFGTIKITDNRDWKGIGGRPERLLLLLSGMIAAVFFPQIFSIQTMQLFLILIIIICFIGNIQRIFFAKKMFGEKE